MTYMTKRKAEERREAEPAGNMPRPEVAVIGGGAAGMMTAATAARHGAAVTLFEREEKRGRKLGITGKGRCNLTNDCTRDEFMENVPGNARFMFASFSAFDPRAVMEYFESLGVPLKVERGRRVFPVSDRAGDVVFALAREVDSSGCRTVHARVEDIKVNDVGGFTVTTAAGSRSFDRVVIATGGMSYPRTGSTGDGYAFARSMGHMVTELRPSLVPIESGSALCREAMGLTLKNVSLTVRDAQSGKIFFSDFGELLFTHFGLSGPLALSASAAIRNVGNTAYEAVIDLKPALDEKTLDRRVLSDFEKFRNRDLVNSLGGLLPQKLISPFVELVGIAPDKKVNSITRAERARIISCLKNLVIPISGLRPVEEAVVTAGGVSVKEINPKTMESKLVPGLYFAGEIIDVDGYTGGYNLQIAWSTGHAAGIAAAFTGNNNH